MVVNESRRRDVYEIRYPPTKGTNGVTIPGMIWVGELACRNALPPVPGMDGMGVEDCGVWMPLDARPTRPT